MSRILLVDDNEDNLYYLSALCTAQGWSVETAHHGAEALHKARNRRPDLVISDLLMPVMDGYTLLRHWRNDETLAQTHFVVYTATYTDAEDERLALSLGADAFILKPAEPDAFLARIREILTSPDPSRTSQVRERPTDEGSLLAVYNEALIRKLEAKTLELEKTNQKLQEDIAERRRAEALLQRHERELRELADQLERERRRLVAAQAVAKVGSWETDLDTFDVTWSEQTHRIFGTDPATFTPTHRQFLELVHEADRTPVDEAFSASLADGLPRSIEHRIRLADGQVKVVEERWQVVTGDAGKPRLAVGTCQDITERKQLEQQYLRAQRLESIGTVAAGIAHDLNNVLAPILMSIGPLLNHEPDGERRDMLAMIEASAQRGADMIKQVLSFARGMESRRIPVDLGRLIGDIGRILTETFPKNIGVEIRRDPTLWTLNADPTQIQQVLLNLCVNARDAMPNGGSLVITARNRNLAPGNLTGPDTEQSGPHVCIEIEDTGCGIPEEIVEKIFDPFFTTKDIGKGTGLGLATSLAIVQSHGGTLRVDSRPPTGTRFRLCLPARTEPLELAPPEPARPPTPGTGETILVVDDEASIRLVTKRTLESFGFEVLVAVNGAEAVALYACHQARVALVITDMMMPVMDGPAAIRALRRMNPAVVIIGTSGLGGTWSGGSNGQPDQPDAFLDKPFTAETLLATVQAALAARC